MRRSHLARDHVRRGGGVVAVMHDLNPTAAFAGRVVLMGAGRIAAAGFRGATLSKVNGCRVRVGALPPERAPFVLRRCCHWALPDLGNAALVVRSRPGLFGTALLRNLSAGPDELHGLP